jgi:hypothetical protein
MDLCDIMVMGLALAIALAWLAFSVYTGILLFGVEVNVECFTEDEGSPVDVAKRFNNTLIILFTS